MLADILRGRAAKVAELWPRELAADGDGPLPIPPDQAAQLVAAVITALRTDDCGDLVAIAMVRPGVEVATAPMRVERVLRAVDAVRRALVSVLEAEGIDSAARAALDRQAPAAFARVARRFAAAATRVLAESAAVERRAVGTESLGVTLHELRRPLTILSSYSQLLLGGTLGELDDKVGGAVQAMAQATETMGRLVNGLSALARLDDPTDQPDRSELAVADLVGAALAEVGVEAELRQVVLRSDVDEGLWVRGDREELVLALCNLVTNAVKHAPAGTEVTVTGRRHGDEAVLRVRDHGPGFPAEDTERLFEKYYRAASEREQGIPGSGLGLYIVATVARRHGGRVAARLPDDGGAEFELVLPAATP